MFKNRFAGTWATAALCCALVVPAGCKKKEEAKAPVAPGATEAAAPGVAAKVAEVIAAPVLPDVELVAGENIAGWMSLQSPDALFNAADALGVKLGLTAPGASIKQQVLGELTKAASGIISGFEWLDTTKTIHFAYQDDTAIPPPVAGAPAAAPAPVAPADPAAGAFAVVHVTDKAKALAAFTIAKKGPEADGHDAKFEKDDKVLYADFLGNTMVLTINKDRFAKVKGFVDRLDKVAVPSLMYVGVSVEDLAKSRAVEIETFLKQFEAGMGLPGATGMPNQAQLMQAYAKMLRSWVTDMRRFEMLIGADVNNTRFEVRLTAKDGTKLQKQLAAGKGRTPKDIVNLLPANSFLTFAASVDPASAIDNLDDTLIMVKDMLKLDQAAYDSFAADVKQAAKLQDGNSALALFADGQSPLGMMVVAGSTDGETAMKLTKRLVANLLLKVIADQAAEKTKAGAAEDPNLAVVKQALQEQKLQPLLDKFGPMAAAKGVTLAANSSKDGDATCDVLDVTMDWTKMGGGNDAKMAQSIVGGKTAFSLCTTKGKISMAMGPGALEIGKHAVQNKPTGLIDAPVYKAATAAHANASWVMYINPGVALAAFKGVSPAVPQLQGDRAVVMSCQNRAHSIGCEVEVPVDLIVAAKNLAMPSQGGAMPPPGAMPPLGAAVPPTVK